MRKNKYIFAAVAAIFSAALFITSCNLMTGNNSNSTGVATVTFSVDDVSRTVNPDVAASDLTNITVKYKSSSASTSDASTTLVSGKTLSELTGSSYDMSEGTYVFTATASVNEINYIATVTKTLVSGTNSISFTFKKTTPGTLVAGTGYIDVEFTISDNKVKGVKAELDNWSDDSVKIALQELTITDGKVSYKIGEGSPIATSVDSGTYRLIVEFYSDEDCTEYLGSYREIVNVTKGFTSSAERTIEDASYEVYTVTYHLNYGDFGAGVTAPESVTRKTEYTLPTAAHMTKDYADFVGWYLDAEFTDSITELKNITENIDLYAKWNNYIKFTSDEVFGLGLINDASEGYGKAWDGVVEYSIDGATWTQWDGSTEITAEFSGGSYCICLRGSDNTSFTTGADLTKNINSNQKTTSFRFTESDGGNTLNVECTGKIMSLLDYESPETAVMGDYCFYRLFNNCTALTSTPVLPAETLSTGCYAYIFDGCTSITSAPELPATTLKDYCYAHMFYNCTSLTEACELPAENLAAACYQSMFESCTSLTTVPELPAVTLTDNCYDSMFYCCSAITVPPVLPATTLTYKCYYFMFSDCTSLTYAPALPALDLAESCYYAMFSGCESITEPVELPATTLTIKCYEFMFSDSGITSTPELPAETLTKDCYYEMFSGCADLTYLRKITAVNADAYCAMEGMFKNCENLYIVEQDEPTSRTFLTITTADGDSAVKDIFTGCNSSGYTGSGTVGKSYKLKTTYNVNWKSSDIIKVDDESDYESTLYDVAMKAGKIVIGSSAAYASYVTGLTQYDASETIMDEVYAYFDPTAEKPDLYVLAEAEIVFEDDDNQIFRNCTKATEITLDNIDTSAMTDMSEMFKNCINLTSIDLSSIDTSVAANLSEMFRNCCTLTSLDVSGFDISKVENMSGLFNGCSGLTDIDVSSFDTSSVTDMSSMFKDCSGITTLSLENFDFSKVTKTASMFKGCTALTTILVPQDTDLSSIDTTDGEDMFTGCTNLVGSSDTSYDSSHTDNTYAVIDGGESAPGYFSVELCLTFRGNEAYTLSTSAKYWNGTIEYSTDKENWTSSWDGSAITAAESSDGSYYIYLRGKNNTYFATRTYHTGTECNDGYNYTYSSFVFTESDSDSSLQVECNGNIMTLLDYEDPSSAVMDESCFAYLFYNCTALVTPPKLPAATLAPSCYSWMFFGCSKLTEAPELPATTLENCDYCYECMFYKCTSLTEPPELPATTLSDGCYSNMFYNCTSLTSVPELPAEELAYKCYLSMLGSCTSITEAPELPATTLKPYCYRAMFYGCSSLIACPELPTTTLAAGCYTSMFSNCTSLTTTVELPATQMYELCYQLMFSGDTSLTSIKKISATNLDCDRALMNMFSGCTGFKVEEVDSATSDCFLTVTSVDDTVSSGSAVFEYCNLNNFTSSRGNLTAGKSYRIITE